MNAELSPPALSWRRTLQAPPDSGSSSAAGSGGDQAGTCTRPQVYDDGGTGEVIYTDEDGAYPDPPGLAEHPYEPAPSSPKRRNKTGVHPVCLFIHHKDTPA